MVDVSETMAIEGIIAQFIGDVSRCSMELPHMSPAQRKHAKMVLEQYQELSSESYGFGKDRTLHLFKKSYSNESSTSRPSVKDMVASGAASAVSVKNTFIDDWSAPKEDLFVLKTMPAYLPQETVQCVMDGPVCKLDLSTVKDIECSTADPSTSPSAHSPASTSRDSLPDCFRLPPGLELEVQNTFVHFKDACADERQVQSMPGSMFTNCLLAETLTSRLDEAPIHTPTCSDNSKENAQDGAILAGTEIVIVGLSKCPSFNGMQGTVESFDEQSGRYSIRLASSVSGKQTAMLKRDNFQVIELEVGAEVVIEGLAKCPAFNDLVGTVQSFEESSGRYRILLHGNRTAMVKRDNLRLFSIAAGTEVVLEGLLKCPAFNGLKGIVQAFEAKSGRYNIMLSSPVGACKSTMVKRSNFRLAQGDGI